MLPFEYLVVLDFEATCKPGAPPVPQEVIEFPSVLVSLRDAAVVDSFESFVRPVVHPELDPFCTELTSIRQDDVASAPTFEEVLTRHRSWLGRHGLLEAADPRREPLFLTCGDWDLGTMLPGQCEAAGIAVTDLPRAYRRWCNVKKVFGAAFQRDKGFGMPTMLTSLGLELVGRHHRGIDDCQNIARIALALAAHGARFDVTARLSSSHYPSLPIVFRRGDVSADALLTRRRIPSLLGLASGVFHTQIDEVRTETGEVLTEEDLFELPAGSTVLVPEVRRPDASSPR